MARVTTRSTRLSPARLRLLREQLERLYDHYNHAAFIAPDPLQLVWEYPDAQDREVVGFIAASLSYGRVASILTAARQVLQCLGPHPAHQLAELSAHHLQSALSGWKYRWSQPDEMCHLLLGLGKHLRDVGSLERAFLAGNPSDKSGVTAGLSALVAPLGVGSSLVPNPSGTGASKRLHMFLRWMVRSDSVDPGVWRHVSPSMLRMPLDVHSFRWCARLGFTHRATPDHQSVEEVTASLRKICPDDPIRYDFALTRMGIRNEGLPPESISLLSFGSE